MTKKQGEERRGEERRGEERRGEEEEEGVCGSLLAGPEESCGADRDMKGLLAPNDCAAAW